MNGPIILVTGANGQLGKEFRELSAIHTTLRFVFVTREELPIQEEEKVKAFFSEIKPAYCINCAAYTAVDKAETERELAYQVNATATGILASVSKQFNTRFIHISTDYVFNGQSPVPYTEENGTEPVNYYGASKLKGEQLCMHSNPDVIIIRTAWVYSAFGHNFVKTMLRLMKERESLQVVNDQVGAPTYAGDLSKAIIHIIENKKWLAGIYHYSNTGKISWYDFAIAIKELSGSNCVIKPIASDQYPTVAKRPSFSLLNTEKIRETFNIDIPDWKKSLEHCLKLLKPHP